MKINELMLVIWSWYYNLPEGFTIRRNSQVLTEYLDIISHKYMQIHNYLNKNFKVKSSTC